MFGLFQRSRPARSPLTPARARPSLEQLEDRLCPVAPMLTDLSAAHVGSNLVVTGRVFDENPQTAVVTLSGAVSASVIPNTFGEFTYSTPWQSGTQITAIARDSESLSSLQTSCLISGQTNANLALGLSLSVAYGTQKQVTLSGQVFDVTPGGRTVSFTGAVSGSAVTDSQGNFSVTLTASTLGSVTAYTTDSSGLVSATSMIQLKSSIPVILDFTVQERSDGYLFTGRVVDESPGGLTVYLGGVPISLTGKSVTVQADGTFSILIQLNGTQSDEGTVTAKVTDWWGLESVFAMCDVHQTGV